MKGGIILLLLLGPMTAAAQDASVLVKTEPARKGTLPDLIAAYDTAAPAFGGGMTLSLPQEGRVLSVAVTPGEQVRSGDRLSSSEPRPSPPASSARRKPR